MREFAISIGQALAIAAAASIVLGVPWAVLVFITKLGGCP